MSTHNAEYALLRRENAEALIRLINDRWTSPEDVLKRIKSSLYSAIRSGDYEAEQAAEKARPTFRGKGHTRTSRDSCDTCGLTGQAFEVSAQKGWAICCPMPQFDGSVTPQT